MEHEGTVAEASWGSFDPSVPVEDSEVMAQLLGPHYFSNETEPKTTMFWPNHDSNSNFDSSNFNDNDSSNYWTQLNIGSGSSGNASSFMYSGGPSYEGYYLSDPNATSLMNEDQMENSSLEIGLGSNFEKPMISLNEEPSGEDPYAMENKRRLSLGEDDKDETSTEFFKKKSRASPMPASKRVKNSKSRKSQKSVEEDGNGENSSGYSSEDDSNESPNINGRAKKSSSNTQNVKSRANRGSATDPQSLYARKRRERINERLKILQGLVPNGTKVDISTMLEEAVQYVNFLQLQIKLLSSDDLWMYAPIAYNGMNIGLDLRIAPPQP